jgi:hypothetical protein
MHESDVLLRYARGHPDRRQVRHGHQGDQEFLVLPDSIAGMHEQLDDAASQRRKNFRLARRIGLDRRGRRDPVFDG